MLETISLQEYAKRVGYNETENITLGDIQEFAADVLDWTIYSFLYKNATVFLNRKKETFDKVVSITKNKNKYRKCVQ